jgi:hypothetical protein
MDIDGIREESIETQVMIQAAFCLAPSRMTVPPLGWLRYIKSRVLSKPRASLHLHSRPLFVGTYNRTTVAERRYAARAMPLYQSTAQLHPLLGRGVKGATGVVTKKRRPVANSIIRVYYHGFLNPSQPQCCSGHPGSRLHAPLCPDPTASSLIAC